MGHLTNRAGKFWWIGIKDSLTTFSYTNNRNSAWEYDDDGRVVDSDDVQYEFDAAGRMIETISDRSEIDLYYDGDGKRLKSVNAMTDTETPPNTTTETVYYLPSSIAGDTVVELTWTGAKKEGHVFAGSRILAQEKPGSTVDNVLWRMTDAAGYHFRMTNTYGNVEPDHSAELDSFGTDAGLTSPGPTQLPQIPGEGQQGALNSIGFGDPIASGMGECRVNGSAVDCEQALAALSNESGYLVPGAGGTGRVVDIPGIGFVLFHPDPSRTTWRLNGNPDFSLYDGIAVWGDDFAVLGGGEGTGTGSTEPPPGGQPSDCSKFVDY